MQSPTYACSEMKTRCRLLQEHDSKEIMFGRLAGRTSFVARPSRLSASRQASTLPEPIPSSSTSASSSVAEAPEPELPSELLELVSNEGLFRSFSNAFLHAPDLLPNFLNSYSVSVVLLVLALRAGFTLPVNLWQRRRSDRMQDIVVPKMEAWALQARETLRARCRKQGKSYEEYVEIYKEAVGASASLTLGAHEMLHC